MKILFINESTMIKGGVDTILEMEMDGLRKNGFEVDLIEFSHKNFQNGKIAEKIKGLYFFLSDKEKIKFIKKKIDLLSPDIVHFHNTYPLFNKPIWSNELFNGIKVIQHLHNYYPFCLNSIFFRDGQICTECFQKDSFFTGVANSCYDNSIIKSLIVNHNRLRPSEWLDHSNNVDWCKSICC